ncbi:MAG: diaminopimelate decarboxylase, partial [Phototrophicales bacterium]
YSLGRILENVSRLQQFFSPLNAHIHYSVKANGNLSILRALVANGLGLDVVSGGEIYRALLAGTNPEKIVFAGVGKTIDDIQYALDTGVGWFNVENVTELKIINTLAGQRGRKARIALRLNPNVTANTHPYIATGHGGAKFGMTEEVITNILARQTEYPHVDIQGVHIHIGSQLGDTTATLQA